jgi:hypothetical protein
MSKKSIILEEEGKWGEPLVDKETEIKSNYGHLRSFE